MCPRVQAQCGEVCADLQSSPSNCGACGVACATGQVCVAGACTSLLSGDAAAPDAGTPRDAGDAAAPDASDAGTPPKCNAQSCSGNGTCADNTGSIVCACNAGYSGATCSNCAGGYQDNDNNRTCKLACAATTCSGHGTCADTSGTATCTCDAGYTGASCSNCATGLQDKDNNMTCAPECSDRTCSGNGACNDNSGTATCTCNPGYTGATCNTCAAGYQDNDNNMTCTLACNAGTCSGNGTCSDNSGTATCTCNAGYAGAACSTCAAGYQDNDNNMTCTLACNAGTCSGNGTCRDNSGTATCTCTGNFTGAACDVCLPNFTGAACDQCVAGKFGSNCDYDLVYDLNVPVGADYNVPTDVGYTTDNSGVAGAFTRVAYRMTLGTESVWVEMDAFTTNKAQLGIPVDWIFDQEVSNMTVISNARAVASISRPTNGKIEFWSNCYAPTGGDNGIYDHDDEHAGQGTDCYGSFQVHAGTNTIFAYNRWSGGGNSDVGFGNNPASGLGGQHQDWTFAANAGLFTSRRIEVFVK
jgi:hypothetical protein